MLHLLYGPAASGKTDLLMGRIRTAVAARTPGQVLLVPEQYSHEAERALCSLGYFIAFALRWQVW